ncbi:hypothetical protein C8R46DRAFT_890631, partial [Mycena filopes]
VVLLYANLPHGRGCTVSPEKTLTMESADSNQSTMAGVEENLKFSIGAIDLHLQAHVVDGAPFDILLGRPFFRFTECQRKDRSEGSQELTLTCPNTGKMIIVPTKTKQPRHVTFAKTNRFASVEVGNLDFA